MALTKAWYFHRSKLLCEIATTYLAEKGLGALVDIKYRGVLRGVQTT